MVSKRVSGKQVLRINPKKSLSPFYGEIIVYPHRLIRPRENSGLLRGRLHKGWANVLGCLQFLSV